MTADDALVLIAEGQRHVSAGFVLVGYYEAGMLPEGIDIVPALAGELTAVGKILDRCEQVLR